MSTENTQDKPATEGCAAAAGYAAPRPNPPLGPEPEWIWREKRMWHLIERLAGYANQTEHAPQESWLTELRTRIDEVLRHTAPKFRAPPINHNQPLKTMPTQPKPETNEVQTAKAVDPATPLFAILGRRLYAKITSHVADGECDEWCEEVMEMATEIGLAKRELYDPEIHGSIDAEPKVSTIWTWRHLPDGWKKEKPVVEFIDPATGAEQLDLSKRGVLIIHDSSVLANVEASHGER